MPPFPDQTELCLSWNEWPLSDREALKTGRDFRIRNSGPSPICTGALTRNSVLPAWSSTADVAHFVERPTREIFLSNKPSEANDAHRAHQSDADIRLGPHRLRSGSRHASYRWL